MSTSRRLYDVVVEPSAAELFHSHAQTEPSSSKGGKLPSLFTFSYNFKPDSAADSTRGALFVPGQNPSDAAEFQLELDHGDAAANGEADKSAKSSGSAAKPAHIFSGPQLPSKTLDLVLVWDESSSAYRLDRLASSFAFKSERSRTTSSSEATQVWTKDAKPPKRRKVGPAVTASTSTSKPPMANTPTQSPGPSSPFLRGRTAVRGPSIGSASGKAAPSPYRRSTGLHVEPEVFEDTPPASTRTSPQSRPVSVPRTTTRLDRTSSGPQRLPSEDEEQGETSLENALALQLEQELGKVGSESDNDQSDVTIGANRMPHGQSSPHARLRRDGRFGQADTPRAHSPELSDMKADTGSLRQDLANSRYKQAHSSDSSVLSKPSATTHAAAASIGLGLHQTGTGITPKTSPLIDTANLNDNEGGAEDEGDDDLDDFAAELDMSLAEEPQATAARDRRRSTQTSTAKDISRMSQSQRRAYGLGGPRLEEQDLEDSD